MTALTIRTKSSIFALVSLILLSLTLIAILPKDTVAQTEDTWENKVPKTQLGDVYGAVEAGGKIYIYRNSFICYDPSTNNSTRKSPLILPFQGIKRGDSVLFDAVTLQNNIYIIGGVHSVRRKNEIIALLEFMIFQTIYGQMVLLQTLMLRIFQLLMS